MGSLTVTTKKMDSEDYEFDGYTFVSASAATKWGTPIPVTHKNGTESWGELSRSTKYAVCTISEVGITITLNSDNFDEPDERLTVLGTTSKVI